jgi:hypothetical protein
MDRADLREAIYDQICSLVPAIWGTGSPAECNVFWGWTAPGDTEKPFIVLTFTGDIPSINTPCGMFIQFDVDLIGDEGNIMNLDPIADDIVSILHQTDITTPTGRIIRPEYRRDSRNDYWSEDFRANVIHMRFLLPTDFW